MRNVLIGCGFLILLFCAVPAEACQECYEYYSDQTLDWCQSCRYVYCGHETCTIKSYSWPFSYRTYCEVLGEDCAEQGGIDKGWCGTGPVERADLPKRLDETWRLAAVRIYRPDHADSRARKS